MNEFGAYFGGNGMEQSGIKKIFLDRGTHIHSLCAS